MLDGEKFHENGKQLVVQILVSLVSNRMGSAGGKTTVSLAQVSLVEASKGVRFPPAAERACPSWHPRAGLCYPKGRDAANAALGVDC